MRWMLGSVLAMVVSAGSAQAAGERRHRVLERLEEKCSAEVVTVIKHRNGGNNEQVQKGQTTGFLRMTQMGSSVIGAQPPQSGEVPWHCGDTSERSRCAVGTTHVRIHRAASGRDMTLTCYRVETCMPGKEQLAKLDDRCGEDVLRVGGQRIKFRETKRDIPYSAADLSPPGGVRWYCGDTAERSQCPPGTTVLDVERRDRDTRVFHIQCIRDGASCEPHYDHYAP